MMRRKIHRSLKVISSIFKSGGAKDENHSEAQLESHGEAQLEASVICKAFGHLLHY